MIVKTMGVIYRREMNTSRLVQAILVLEFTVSMSNCLGDDERVAYSTSRESLVLSDFSQYRETTSVAASINTDRLEKLDAIIQYYQSNSQFQAAYGTRINNELTSQARDIVKQAWKELDPESTPRSQAFLVTADQMGGLAALNTDAEIYGDDALAFFVSLITQEKIEPVNAVVAFIAAGEAGEGKTPEEIQGIADNIAFSANNIPENLNASIRLMGMEVTITLFAEIFPRATNDFATSCVYVLSDPTHDSIQIGKLMNNFINILNKLPELRRGES
jgi:hypothetical protein